MKRYLWMAAVALLAAAIWCGASAETGSCGDNLTWTLDGNGTLTISGTGEMQDYGTNYYFRDHTSYATEENPDPFFWDYDIRRVVIKSGVTTIGDCAFWGCSSMTQISIPDTVVYIGYRAFADSGLTSVNVPGSVNRIVDLAFENCHSLTQVSVADGVRIWDGAFKGCSALADAQGFVIVEGRLYDYAYGPTTVTIPNTVTSIDPYAFVGHGDPCVTEIVLPDTVSVIEPYTFWDGDGFDNEVDFTDLHLVVPTSVKRFGEFVFAWDLDYTIDYAGSPLDWMRVSLCDIRFTDPEAKQIPVNFGHDHTDAPGLVIGQTVPVTLAPLGSAWFSFVPAETAVYSFVTAGETGTLACMHDAGYTEIVEGDRTGENGTSRITVQLTAGETYFFGVGLKENAAGTTSVTLLKDGIAWTLDNGTLTISGSGELFIHPWNEYVGWWTMSDTRLEITRVIISEGVTSIGDGVFEECSNMTSITVPSTVTSIGEAAFRGCSALTAITLPEGLTRIADYAFDGCSALTRMTIPASVTCIESSAFMSCTGITQFIVTGGMSYGNTVYYSSDYAIYDRSQRALLHYPAGRSGVFSIPGSVCSIGDYAFASSSLTGITLQNNIMSIGECAFTDCHNLTEITLPSSVNSIGDAAFRGSGLTGITIPAGITRIGDSMFSGCDQLASISIPVSVTRIGEGAFYDCDSLRTVYYGGSEEEWYEISIEGWNDPLRGAEIIFDHTDPVASGTCGAQGDNLTWTLDRDGTLVISGTGAMADFEMGQDAVIDVWTAYKDKVSAVILKEGVTTVGNYGLAGFHYLKTVSIPDSVSMIGYGAFSSDSNLTSFTVSSGNQSYTAVDGILFSLDGYELVKYPGGKAGSAYTIPSGVSILDPYAFDSCFGLSSVTISDGVAIIGERAFRWSGIVSIEFPDSVASIGRYVFEECSDLTSAVIPQHATAIAAGMFCKCYKLTSFTIPANVSEIKDEAFYGCYKMTDITIPLSVTRIGDRAFCGCNSLRNIWYGGTFEQWRAISVGEDNGSLHNAILNCNGTAYQICGDNLFWSLDSDGVLTISGYGPMYDYDSMEHPSWPEPLTTAPWGWQITGLIIEDGVTGIGANAFASCEDLTWVRFSPTVSSIGELAFTCCGLTEVTLPENLTSISWGAFNRTKVTEVTIPANVTSIGGYAFSYCFRLTTVTIPDSVTNIDQGAFSGCESLIDVFYPGSEAQWNQITIDSDNDPLINATKHFNYTGAEIIAGGTCGEGMTWTLDSEGTLTISGTGTVTGGNWNTEDIVSIVFEDGVTGIRDELFWGYENLTTLTLPGSLTTIGDAAFCECGSLSDILIPDGIPTQEKLLCYRGLLYDLVLPASITEMGSGVFQNTGLNRIVPALTLPEDLTAIEAEAFAGTPITGVSLTDIWGDVTIGNRAFAGCTQLRVVIFSSGSLEIPVDAFEGCSDLILAGHWALEPIADVYGFEFVPEDGYYGN